MWFWNSGWLSLSLGSFLLSEFFFFILLLTTSVLFAGDDRGSSGILVQDLCPAQIPGCSELGARDVGNKVPVISMQFLAQQEGTV